MDYVNLVILGCALVTFIPRLIPALFIDKLNFPPKAEKGQEWPPGVDVFPRTLPNFAHPSQDQAQFPGVLYYFASLNKLHVGWGEV